MSYAKYPKEMKEAVVSRIMSGEETISDIGRDTGININTLYRWRDAARKKDCQQLPSTRMLINGAVRTSSLLYWKQQICRK